MCEENKNLKTGKEVKRSFSIEKIINIKGETKSNLESYEIPSILLIVGIVCYLVSLIGCEGTQAECLKNFDQTKIKYFVIILVVSATSFTVNYMLLIYKRKNYLIVLFQSIIIIYLCFVHDTGSDLKKHGSYNRIFLALMMFIAFFLSNTFMFVYYLMRKKLLNTILFLAIAI